MTEKGREMTDRPVIVPEDKILDRDWGVSAIPTYKVSEVAKVFFAMSPSWVRKHREQGHFGALRFRRQDPERGSASALLFLLSDIQPMAEALFEQGMISARELANTLNVISAQAALYGLLDEPAEEPAGDPEEALDAG